MRKLTFMLFLSIGLLLTSCATSGNAVKFTEADQYFFRSDAKQPDGLLVIDSQEALERHFGMAATMGKDGQPTPIDFTKSFAVAKVLPVTNHPTTVQPLRVEKDGKGGLRLVDRVVTKNETMGYSAQPMFLIVLDKKYKDCKIVEKNQ